MMRVIGVHGDDRRASPFNVRFICTGNSARSISAEALTNYPLISQLARIGSVRGESVQPRASPRRIAQKIAPKFQDRDPIVTRAPHPVVMKRDGTIEAS